MRRALPLSAGAPIPSSASSRIAIACRYFDTCASASSSAACACANARRSTATGFSIRLGGSWRSVPATLRLSGVLLTPSRVGGCRAVHRHALDGGVLQEEFQRRAFLGDLGLVLGEIRFLAANLSRQPFSEHDRDVADGRRGRFVHRIPSSATRAASSALPQ